MSSAQRDPWNIDYVNQSHLEAFAQALNLPDNPVDGTESPFSPKSPRSPTLTDPFDKTQTWNFGPVGDDANGGGEVPIDESGDTSGRVEKLTATSDFAPVHHEILSPVRHAEGLSYQLFRWPLLSVFLFFIAVEFYFYVFVRQLVNVWEYLATWRGKRGKLRAKMRKSQTYEEWVTIAKELDALLGFDKWKEQEEDVYFDWSLVKRVRRRLYKERTGGDVKALMGDLQTIVRPNYAATQDPKMYSETFYGTKTLVESHVREVVADLESVRLSNEVPLDQKRKLFRQLNRNYGASALCLSGGAYFGYYHFGVVRALLDADLLPRVITGTSAGGIVAALVCTRTDAELKELLVPKLADKITACEDPFRVWIKRWWQTGARFSAVDWARKSMWFTRGSLTFREAYERTGRIMNVSVVPHDRHSPTILLNYITAPNCVIWSAILASAAVPGILNPVVLMSKAADGRIHPHNIGGSRFKDGSLREDIPLAGLHTHFNSNFSIVSQVNPHVHLFFFSPRGNVGRPVSHRRGKGWRGGFVLSALESYIKLDMNKHFKVIRDLDLMPQLLQSDWSGVFTQRFSGTLTLTPRSTIGDWFRILSDPSQVQLARMMQVGQRVTWPALRMVRNRILIERAIARGRAEVRTNMAREKTTNDRSPPNGVDTVVPSLQLPLESDNETDVALRAKRAKSTPVSLLQDGSARRRRLSSRQFRRSGSDNQGSTSQFASYVPSGLSGLASRRYIGQTLRTLPTIPSPFRTRPFSQPVSQSPSQSEFPAPPAYSDSQDRRQNSFSRWWNNASDSSSSGDEFAIGVANVDSGSEDEEEELRRRFGAAVELEDAESVQGEEDRYKSDGQEEVGLGLNMGEGVVGKGKEREEVLTRQGEGVVEEP
ncbi:hypothetical protein M231_07332 [Tremella mesenterica]|uniref:PNPLA domain-containing protein n=1 Tax=Tremella mesenterica TaxID=5217 RepID=A0A4Q1B9G8_TREME|nr:hypothetical protein M231_07332 [Tremella mesenterica]